MWLSPEQTPPFYGAREGLPEVEATFAIWDVQRSFTSWLLRGIPTEDSGSVIDVLLFGVAAIDLPTVAERALLRPESPGRVAEALDTRHRLEDWRFERMSGVVLEIRGEAVGHVLCGGMAFKQWRGDYWEESGFEQFPPDPTRT